MNKIWIVMGTTGEYSDRREWPVLAYLDRARAEERVRLASQRASEILVLSGEDWEARESAINEHDPDAGEMDYTGTRYYLMAVELETPDAHS